MPAWPCEIDRVVGNDVDADGMLTFLRSAGLAQLMQCGMFVTARSLQASAEALRQILIDLDRDSRKHSVFGW